MLEVVRYCQCQMRIEYPLTVNNWLKGNLDYLLRSTNNLLVIEAKNDDLTLRIYAVSCRVNRPLAY